MMCMDNWTYSTTVYCAADSGNEDESSDEEDRSRTMSAALKRRLAKVSLVSWHQS